MNIEKEIKTIVEALHSHYVHLVDGYELNNIMPKLAREYRDFTVNYIPEGGFFDIAEATGHRNETSHIQMMWCGVVPFNKDATVEADNISAIFEDKKAVMNNFVDAVNASGLFETLTHYSYQCIPIRFDAVCACLITTFDLQTKGECREVRSQEPLLEERE